MQMSVKIEGIEEAKKLCSSTLMRDVLKYTMQDIAKGASVTGKNKIKDGYNIRPSDLNRKVKVKSTGDPLEQVVEVRDEGRPPGIFQMSGRQAVQTALGTWVEVSKRKGAYFIPQAFIATMASSHKGVFIRYRGGSGKGGRMTRRDVMGKNPPIHEIYGPWVTSLFADVVVTRAIDVWLVQNVQRIFNQKLEWKTGGLLGRSAGPSEATP